MMLLGTCSQTYAAQHAGHLSTARGSLEWQPAKVRSSQWWHPPHVRILSFIATKNLPSLKSGIISYHIISYHIISYIIERRSSRNEHCRPGYQLGAEKQTPAKEARIEGRQRGQLWEFFAARMHGKCLAYFISPQESGSLLLQTQQRLKRRGLGFRGPQVEFVDEKNHLQVRKVERYEQINFHQPRRHRDRIAHG